MKKLFLSLLMLATMQVVFAVEETVTFDFTYPMLMNSTPAITNVPDKVPNNDPNKGPDDPDYLPFQGDFLSVQGYVFSDGQARLDFTTDGYGTLTKVGDYCYLSLGLLGQLPVKVVGDKYTIRKVVIEGFASQLTTLTYPECYSNKEWVATPNVNTNEIIFRNISPANAVISKVIVTYDRAADPLTFVSSNPENGSTVQSSFSYMNLYFNTDVTTVSGQATISGPGIDGSKTMSSTLSGSTVKLSVSPALTAEGLYTVHVPAGVFKAADGSANDELNISFRVQANHATFAYANIDPAPGTFHTYEALPNPIVITYPKPVKLNNSLSTIVVLKDGDEYMAANLTVSTDDPSSVLIETGNIKAQGTYTFLIPEGAIHTTFYGTSTSENDYWNPEFSLDYVVKTTTPPDPLKDLKDAANLLLQNSTNNKLGYPTTNSTGFQALNELLNKEDLTEDELKAAILTYYNETNVNMPIVDSWYKIAGVNSEGQNLYLTFADDNTKVSLGNSFAGAAAFKVKEITDGKVVFETKNNKYLHVLTTLPMHDGTSDTNLTDTQTDVNKLSLAKFLASSVEGSDPAILLGKFTMYGSLGAVNGTEEFAYAMLDFENTKIVTYPNMALAFNASKSSAFIFTETSEPVVTGDIIPEARLTPHDIEKGGDELVLMIKNVKSATLKEDAQPYFSHEGEKIPYTSTILMPKGDTGYEFYVNTTGLGANYYTLVLPEGTFDFVSEEEGRPVKDVELYADFRIKTGSGTGGVTVTPTATLSPTSIQAGENMTLIIGNVKKATLNSGATPYFKYTDGEKSGQQVQFPGTILTAKGTLQFGVNTSGLEPGGYALVLPVGTFTYQPEDENQTVNDVQLVANFTITSSGGGGGGTETSVTPTATMSSTSFNAGTSVVLTIGKVQKATIANSSLPYYKYTSGPKMGEKVYFTGGAVISALTTTTFAVNTTGLSEGSYRLVLPKGTFIFTPLTAGQIVVDTELSVDFNIITTGGGGGGGGVLPTNFNYTYDTFYRYLPAQDYRTNNFYMDTDLNDFIIYIYEGMYSGLEPNPNVKVTVKSTLFGSNIASGHFEKYPNIEEELGNRFAYAIAIKFVPDVPIKAGDLDNFPGIYGFHCDSAAFGDANYGAWMQDNSSVSPTDCIVNVEKIIGSYTVNNSKATTGIRDVNVDNNQTSIIYDLSGRRVTTPAKKGVYIVNGKKVVMK